MSKYEGNYLGNVALNMDFYSRIILDQSQLILNQQKVLEELSSKIDILQQQVTAFSTQSSPVESPFNSDRCSRCLSEWQSTPDNKPNTHFS